MGRASASVQVPGRASEAEALWYDPVRWPAWIDGFGHVVDLAGTWPASGAAGLGRVAEGRGRVLETVVAYEPRTGQTVEVEDGRLHGTPAGRVHARPRQRRGDVLADLRAQGAQPADAARSTCSSSAARSATSLRRTLERFARERRAEVELAAVTSR